MIASEKGRGTVRVVQNTSERLEIHGHSRLPKSIAMLVGTTVIFSPMLSSIPTLVAFGLLDEVPKLGFGTVLAGAVVFCAGLFLPNRFVFVLDASSEVIFLQSWRWPLQGKSEQRAFTTNMNAYIRESDNGDAVRIRAGDGYIQLPGIVSESDVPKVVSQINEWLRQWRQLHQAADPSFTIHA